MIIKSAKDYHLVVGITIVFMFVFTWILAQKGISAWFLIELSLVLVFFDSPNLGVHWAHICDG